MCTFSVTPLRGCLGSRAIEPAKSRRSGELEPRDISYQWAGWRRLAVVPGWATGQSPAGIAVDRELSNQTTGPAFDLAPAEANGGPHPAIVRAVCKARTVTVTSAQAHQ